MIDEIKLSDFVIGFEFQMKSTFGDGCVKTQSEYDRAGWVDCVFEDGDIAYIKRMFYGKNAQNGMIALRHKLK